MRNLLPFGFLILILFSCNAYCLTLSSSDVSVVEGNEKDSIATIKVSISGPVLNDIMIPVEIINMTTDQNDYEIIQHALLIKKGRRNSVYKLKIKSDNEIENDEELFVRLDISGNNDLYFGNNKSSGLIKITIKNDDGRIGNNLFSKHPGKDTVSQAVTGRVITVGPNGEYSKPSKAAKYASEGDIIEIDANGKYLNDTAVWRKPNLTIKGVNGRPSIRSDRLIKNGKAIWVIKGKNTNISNIEFSGARVGSHNGSAIRLEKGSLKLSDCYIHNNESGILVGRSLQSEVIIDNCVFAKNGYGKGKTHNIYIGRIRKFVLANSYSYDAYGGHDVKTRAENNYILYNRLYEGKSSYAIDISNGGSALIMGNLIYQGMKTKNWALVAFGAEGLKHADNRLVFIFNTLQNDYKKGVFINIKPGTEAILANNIFSGNGKLMNGTAILKSNIIDKNMFSIFTPKSVVMENNKRSLVIDRAVPVVSSAGNTILPEYQIIDGNVVVRKLLGKGYDIGAIEYH